jgi:hypothetical protein
MVLSAHISCPVRSLTLWLSAQERMNVRFWTNNKEVKQFVDIAPPWGEPRISSVSWFSLCCVIYVMNFLSDLIMMCNI